MQQACKILTETRGYKSAWIATRAQNGNLVAAAESGFGREFNPVRSKLDHGDSPECCRMALDIKSIVVFHNPSTNCVNCPVSHKYRDAAALAVPIHHNNHAYGVLVAALPTDVADDIEEQSLFTELAGDLGFALYSIENEKERELAVKTLQDSETRYRTLFEASADGILITDAKTKGIQYANPAICQLLGYTEPEFSKLKLSDLYPEKEWKEEASDLDAHSQGKNMLLQEISCLKKDGSIAFADVNTTFITLDGENCLLSFFRDISERKRAEAEHEKLQSQLNQAQKMEAVGRLAGGVAHDYNNMLSVIIGYCELAKDKIKEEDPLHKYIKEIYNAANRSKGITQQLLAFARKVTIAPEVIDLNASVENMLKILRKLIGEDIDLVWHPGKSLWPVLMDLTQLDQILANLCVNARDAITDVGRITIETSKTTIDSDYCSEHAGFIPGDFVLLTVSDDGCGMDRETINNIFEPFFTTKSVGKGTGLGLSTVYGIVKQNNGFINVYSEPGRGTTFRIYLPRHSGDVTGKQMRIDDQVVKGNGETIMVVEDEISILKLTEQVLSKCNYNVLVAKTPTEAIEVVQKHSDEISLLITDVVMPEMNGRELSEQLKAYIPRIKCLYMSGYTANVIAHRGVLDKGLHFIQKPFSTKGLAAKVRQVLDENENG